MDEIEKKARAILAAEYEKNDMGHIAAQIRDSSWIHKADRIPLAAIAAALAERDQLRAEKQEFREEATRWAEEAGRLKALLHDAKRDAGRYNWLRSMDGRSSSAACVNFNIGHDWIERHGEDLDFAIDAAMAAEREVLNG